jgi:hypothetical protein
MKPAAPVMMYMVVVFYFALGERKMKIYFRLCALGSGGHFSSLH